MARREGRAQRKKQPAEFPFKNRNTALPALIIPCAVQNRGHAQEGGKERSRDGMTQEQVAEKLHTKKTAVSRIENHAQAFGKTIRIEVNGGK
ncbi:MAG: helix-turn-helix transcriptional regulator [Candidatus Electrothrix sp. Rat3]|nr:helix-turn-helix transcriptional regulator [Candidatus Electrothrix rattekaaiensis]